jgi:hypothetical protein
LESGGLGRHGSERCPCEHCCLDYSGSHAAIRLLAFGPLVGETAPMPHSSGRASAGRRRGRLRWAAGAIGPGSRVVSARALEEGGWHANHAIDVIDSAGGRHRLVLRRWARPEWIVEDPDFTVEREQTALRLLASPVPAPEVVAADPAGAACDVPALLLASPPRSPAG